MFFIHAGKSRARKARKQAGATGHGGAAHFVRQNSREARLSPLHESTTVASGPRMIKRGRSASEYIPRSKEKDHHLPEIPAIRVKTSADRASSESKATEKSVDTSSQQSPTKEQRSPKSDTAFSPNGQTSSADDALEASSDFARNVRGTSTPIDVSPDVNTNRSQTFNAAHASADSPDTSDRKATDTIDTQQIELSAVNGDNNTGGDSELQSATGNSLP